MQICDAMKFLRIAAVPVILAITGVPAFVSAAAQAKPAAAPAPPPVKLQTYTLPDGSASAGVPAGWQVKGGGAGEIVMTGPQGENITLGQLDCRAKRSVSSGTDGTQRHCADNAQFGKAE